jgi:hypothetical protein
MVMLMLTRLSVVKKQWLIENSCNLSEEHVRGNCYRLPALLHPHGLIALNLTTYLDE